MCDFSLSRVIAVQRQYISFPSNFPLTTGSNYKKKKIDVNTLDATGTEM